jgi:hypothetical protein
MIITVTVAALLVPVIVADLAIAIHRHRSAPAAPRYTTTAASLGMTSGGVDPASAVADLQAWTAFVNQPPPTPTHCENRSQFRRVHDFWAHRSEISVTLTSNDTSVVRGTESLIGTSAHVRFWVYEPPGAEQLETSRSYTCSEQLAGSLFPPPALIRAHLDVSDRAGLDRVRRVFRTFGSVARVRCDGCSQPGTLGT